MNRRDDGREGVKCPLFLQGQNSRFTPTTGGRASAYSSVSRSRAAVSKAMAWDAISSCCCSFDACTSIAPISMSYLAQHPFTTSAAAFVAECEDMGAQWGLRREGAPLPQAGKPPGLAQ